MALKRPLTEEEQSVSAGMRRHIGMLAEVIGQRNLDRPGGLEAAARYIEDTLRSYGYSPRPRAYTVRGKEVRNIEVEIAGESRPDDILIVGAHYDSVDCPAANDNASGVAGVLEIARLLAGRKFRRTLRFVLFVNEEPPFYKSVHMGSLVYARGCKARNERICGMINLETIGCYSDEANSQRYPHPFQKRAFWFLPRRGNFVAFVGNIRSWRFTWKVRRLFKRTARFPSLWLPAPESIEGPGMSDHWCFWQQGYPAVMVTDTAYFRYDHYHKQTDTLDKINFPETARVVGGVAGVVRRLAGQKTR
jgi:Zn-dependent M28 family amino/carboxypeptidase